jgi:hypothetical protein
MVAMDREIESEVGRKETGKVGEGQRGAREAGRDCSHVLENRDFQFSHLSLVLKE